jgi:PelA/Pel-15E family pectate lyase
VLAAQYPNGGWPQVYPLEGGYHDNITFNDDATTHVLELLYAIAKGEPQFGFLDEPQRKQAAEALERGIDCVLRAQVVIDGKKTVWCAQHDALSLEPARARSFEPPTLSGLESSRILQFLMKIKNLTPELKESIESGLAWFESAKITGITRAKRDGRTAYVPEAASTEVYWARFYDIGTGEPVFPDRDGILHGTYEAMAAGKNVGYDYYTTLPGSTITTGQKKWRKGFK